jgi:hypothetical protein
MSSSAVKEVLDKLKREEAINVGGAPLNTPKQHLLDKSELAAKLLSEGKVIRWVNIKSSEKVLSRQAEGWTKLAASEGGVQLGDELALFVAPATVREQRVARQQKLNEERLKSYKTEMEQLAESTARVLRDKYGISVDPGRLFTDEGVNG